jgi:hypothetical protein
MCVGLKTAATNERHDAWARDTLEHIRALFTTYKRLNSKAERKRQQQIFGIDTNSAIKEILRFSSWLQDRGRRLSGSC